jgi:hypothetical protein
MLQIILQRRAAAGACRLVLLGALLLCGSAVSHAQVLYGTLTGNVTDSSGGAIPGAAVEARNTATGAGRTTQTDATGAYLFSDLQPGSYRVTFTAPSFRTLLQENVPISANTVRRQDITLQVSQVTESIVVSASNVMLQTDRADVNAQIQKSQVSNLPIGAGRNYQQLYRILPGFSPPGEAHSDAGNPQRALVTNVNGVSYSTNNTRLDGATISFPWLPHIVAYVPPAEAIETVNIVTNSFDAEQGMAGGAAVNVGIKSGTNEFHGSAHWFHTNSKMRSRPYFFLENRLPKNIFNQVGGTIGGPIKKNKLFFFTDFERTTRREYRQAFRTLPVDALRQGDFSGTGTNIFDPLTGNANGTNRTIFPNNRIPASRFDPAAVYMTNLMPKPNLTTFPSNYFASGTYEFNRDNWDLKVNYNPTDKASMFARYSLSPSNIFDPPSLGEAGGDALAGGQPGNAPGRVQSASVGGTYTISPRLLVDGNIGFTRQRLGAQNVDIDKNYGLEVLQIPGTNGADLLQGGYPRFAISGFSSVGNPNVSNPFLFRDNQWTVVSNLSWIKSSHSLRFGFEYAYYTINHFQPQAAFGPRGGFNFTGGLTALRGTGAAPPNAYNGFADWLLGLPQSMGKDIQYINPAAVRMPSWGFYARDNWQATRKLTINYGMRYEYYPFGTRDHRGFERFDLTTNKVVVGGVAGNPRDTGVDVGLGQIAPRIGLAYRVNDKTVVRTGYGISVDPITFKNMRDAYPATISSQFSGNSSWEAAGSLRTGIPAVIGPDISQGLLDLPAALQTTTFPTDYRRGYIQSFNFTVQREMWGGVSVQAGYVGSRAIRQTVIRNLNNAGPGGGNPGRALYNPGNRIGTINFFTPFNTAQYDSLQTVITKRLAGQSQLGMSYTWSKAIGYADNSDSGLTWNWAPMLERNRAVANFDRTHNFNLYGVYELPFGRGQKWANQGIASWLLGGWQLNGIFSATGGQPFTVTSAGTSVNAPGNTQTADQVKPEVQILGGVGRGATWFDPMAFMPVTDVRFGNSGRNILRGPGRVNLDASVFRNFRLTERVTAQFRAEAFGATNTPQFSNPGANASSPTRNADGTIRALNGFGEITGASGERQLRFALKVFF